MMSNITMETKIAILEHDARERGKMLEALTANQQKQSEMMHQMDKKLDQVLERKECPAIGLCLDLEPKVAELEKELAARNGGYKMLALMLTAASSLGGIVTFILGHFFGAHKQP